MAQINQNVVSKIINNGIKNMQEFGYPGVNAENITTDTVYKLFFENMLKENLGKGFDTEINHLLGQITK